MQRIVHLDLKGAPPKVEYLEKVLLCIKSWGATGVLLEWEDTFPYTTELVDIGSQGGSGGDGVYLQDEVSHIFHFAKQHGLKAIQLIQTIGHMEFVLKHPKYQKLREARESPAVLCPSKPESKALVRAMLEQALKAQPDAEYIHIGADEVWHLGVCPDCQTKTGGNEHKTAALYLDHIQDICIFLRRKRPNITILMWDDMLRNISIDVLKQNELSDLVQPVIWDYNSKEFFQINPSLWENYRQLFCKVWAGSAFKGANGSCQILSPVNRYVSNHEAWIQEVRKYPQTSFAGIILTGWSRYDHYAALCELLPVSLPSLASCLKLLTKAEATPNEAVVCESLPSLDWPGEQVARGVHTFVLLRERAFAFIHGDLVTTWLNTWQIENSYTNPVQVEGIAVAARQLMGEFVALQSELTPHLNAVTGRRSSEEWLKTFVLPLMNKISDLLKVAEARSKAEPSISPLNTLFLWNKYWNVQ
ncbi:hypothetical protein ABMA28_015237 [Loxostege sticticalis]|uniref:beta-N-acetylhexosaminidase n=1 Tax=Loxostege sticticalis TaxID=481309 RepID=A0ABD0TET4_LOXSC